jgi:outer membrane immunogenic protein
MKATVFVAAALMTVATLGGAVAADMPMPVPAQPVYKSPPPAPYSWTGCYGGGGGGYGMWNQDSQLLFGGFPVLAQTTNGGKGWFGQGQVGCDYQFTAPIFNLPVVIGGFGDYEGGNIFGTSSFPGFVGTETESATWAAGARIGTLIAPRILTYFDAGWTQAHFNSVGYNFAVPGGGPSGLSLGAQTYNGWFLGSGFEYAFDWLPVPGLFLKTEYRYSQYESANVPITGALFGFPAAGAALNSQKNTQLISTELIWRFNWFGR